MKILLIASLVITIPIIHQLLIKWLPYRWVVNSLLYPYHIYLIRRSYKRYTPKQKRDAGTLLVNGEQWFKSYWFGRALDNYVCKKYIQPNL